MMILPSLLRNNCHPLDQREALLITKSQDACETVNGNQLYCTDSRSSVASSKRSVSSWGTARKTASKSTSLTALFLYFFARHFPCCALTSCTHGTGQAFWYCFHKDRFVLRILVENDRKGSSVSYDVNIKLKKKKQLMECNLGTKLKCIIFLNIL